jgi:transposase
MSTRLTKDEVSDLINEAKKSSVRFNAEQECIAIDGGYHEPDQGYYGRYVNDKEKIIKAAGIDISRVLPEDNIENILIGNDIVRAVLTDPNLSDLQRQLKKGHVIIDFSMPIRLGTTWISRALWKRRNRIGLTTSWARCSLALRTSSLKSLTSRKLSTKSPSISHRHTSGISPPSQRWIRS